MARSEGGFTLIELMIVVVIIGILAAISIPNFISMQDRAKEGATKANMHTLQMAAEDYNIQNSSSYAPDCASIAPLLPRGGADFKNPFNSADLPYVDGPAWSVPLPTGSVVPGIVAYQDSLLQKYQIAGRGKSANLSLVLNSGM